MAMTLRGYTMRSPEMVRTEWCRTDFPFAALWQTVQSGTLKSFLEEWEKKHPQDLTSALIAALEAYRAGEPSPQFLTGGSLDAGGLEACLQSYLRGSRDLDNLDFLSRNRALLKRLTDPGMPYSAKRAWALYVFLLLHLQFKPRLPIREGDVEVFLEILGQLPDTDLSALSRQDRLALLEGKPCRCLPDRVEIYDGGWKVWHRSDKPLAGLQVSHHWGMLLLGQDGSLTGAVPEEIRHAAQGRKLRQVSVCGGHYALLIADGTVVSDLPVSDWKGISRIQAGVNSLTGIYGNGRVNHCGSTELLQNYTDVEYAITRSQEGQSYFALLRTGNRLCLPDRVLEGVQAVDICRKGYVYATRNSVEFLGFDGEEELLYLQREDMAVEELHCAGDTVLFGMAEKAYLTYLK